MQKQEDLVSSPIAEETEKKDFKTFSQRLLPALIGLILGTVIAGGAVYGGMVRPLQQEKTKQTVAEDPVQEPPSTSQQETQERLQTLETQNQAMVRLTQTLMTKNATLTQKMHAPTLAPVKGKSNNPSALLEFEKTEQVAFPKDFLKGFSPEAPLGTPATPPEITLLNPAYTGVATPKPILECQPLPDVTEYVVWVEAQDPNEVIQTLTLSPTKWQVTTPLLPGQVYKWYVRARKGTTELRSPVVPFRVLSKDKGEPLTRARLALALSYARMGLLDDAERECQAVLNVLPNHVTAQKLLQKVQNQRAALQAVKVSPP